MTRSHAALRPLSALQAAMLLSLAGGAAAQQPATIDLGSGALIARGNFLFAKNCAVGYCHGSEGRASRGPQLRERVWEPRRLHAVTRDGVPGTSMPSWGAILTDHDIWAVTAYIMSLSSAKLDGQTAVIELGAAAPAGQIRSAEAEKGRKLFFDLTNEKRCAVCHELAGRGTAVGPDLAASAQRKSAQELLRDIVDPGASLARGYEQIAVATNDAEHVAGVRKQETKEYLKLYDTSSLPPPLRTIYREQIHAVNSARKSSMPGDYRRLYSDDELNAIVAYLKSGVY